MCTLAVLSSSEPTHTELPCVLSTNGLWHMDVEIGRKQRIGQQLQFQGQAFLSLNPNQVYDLLVCNLR